MIMILGYILGLVKIEDHKASFNLQVILLGHLYMRVALFFYYHMDILFLTGIITLLSLLLQNDVNVQTFF